MGMKCCKELGIQLRYRSFTPVSQLDAPAFFWLLRACGSLCLVICIHCEAPHPLQTRMEIAQPTTNGTRNENASAPVIHFLDKPLT